MMLFDFSQPSLFRTMPNINWALTNCRKICCAIYWCT